MNVLSCVLSFDSLGCEVIQNTSDRLDSLPYHPQNTIDAIAKEIQSNVLAMEDFSYLLFTTKEEQALINGWDVYEVQPSSADTIRTLDQLTHSYHQHHNAYGVGKLKYAGFYGIIPAVRSIVRFNMLNHPLLENLRQGSWLLDYLLNRLNGHPHLEGVRASLEDEFQFIRESPRNTRPVRFCRFILAFGNMIERELGMKLSGKVDFHQLYMATLQFTQKLPQDPLVFISAGLPHFSTGIMRNWGRDTFIAFPGVMLSCHRYYEAEQLLLEYASVSRHALICNLYGDRELARFNSRDATWWWLRVEIEIGLNGRVFACTAKRSATREF